MWFILGISSGLFHALMSMVSKKVLKNTNQYLVAFAYAAFSLPFAFIALLWLDLAPLNFTFWWAVIATSILNVIALVLFMKALKIGELSLTVPFLAFTPIFLIFTSELMLGELPSLIGVIGIISIVGGAYFLEMQKGTGILGPFKALLKNRGAQLVLLVAFIYSITSNLDKIVIQNSSPITRIIVVQLLMALVLLFLISFRSNQKIVEIKSKCKPLLLIGLLTALILLCQMTALTMSIVPYIISLKRTSAFFSVILGFIAFKERNIKSKLLGASLMGLGVFLISTS